MERLDADIGSVETALEQTPEVLTAISVDFIADVFNGMVNHFVFEFVQAFIRFQRVSIDRAAGRYVFADLSL